MAPFTVPASYFIFADILLTYFTPTACTRFPARGILISMLKTPASKTTPRVGNQRLNSAVQADNLHGFWVKTRLECYKKMFTTDFFTVTLDYYLLHSSENHLLHQCEGSHLLKLRMVFNVRRRRTMMSTPVIRLR